MPVSVAYVFGALDFDSLERPTVFDRVRHLRGPALQESGARAHFAASVARNYCDNARGKAFERARHALREKPRKSH
eukprot:7362113-Pyramimonas_sp.AAC.1